MFGGVPCSSGERIPQAHSSGQANLRLEASLLHDVGIGRNHRDAAAAH